MKILHIKGLGQEIYWNLVNMHGYSGRSRPKLGSRQEFKLFKYFSCRKKTRFLYFLRFMRTPLQLTIDFAIFGENYLDFIGQGSRPLLPIGRRNLQILCLHI
jgi:hypothetical protein